MQQKKYLSKTIFIFILTRITAAWCHTAVNAQVKNNKKYNVLFTAIDDLKPILGSYENKTVFTLKIDLLTLFSTSF
jgi:hypothetical protein